MIRNKGAVMLEFAIVLPILITVVFGITELGRALYQENTLTKAVQTGARYIGRIPELDFGESCSDDPAGWNDIVSKATNLIVYGTLSTGSVPLIPNLDEAGAVEITHGLSTETGFSGVCVIRITANATFAGIFSNHYPLFPLFFTETSDDGEVFKINAKTEERYIGL